MQYVNFFTNKVVDNMLASRNGKPQSWRGQYQDVVAYIKNGDGFEVQRHKPTLIDEKKSETAKTCAVGPEQTDVSNMARLSARGARAGYLLGCVMTSSTDWVFGTPYIETASGPVPTEPRPLDTAPRVAFDVLRPRPVFTPVHVSQGLLAYVWMPIAGIGQWIGGNIGAVTAASGFALAQAVQYAVGCLKAKFFYDKVRASRADEYEPFVDALRRVAQQGDKVGGQMFMAPAHLAMNVTLSVAMWTSAGVKGICWGAGALVGAGVASCVNVVDAVKNPKKSAINVWTTGRQHTSQWVDATVDRLDKQAGLHRAMLASAQRDVVSGEVEELHVLHSDLGDDEV